MNEITGKIHVVGSSLIEENRIIRDFVIEVGKENSRGVLHIEHISFTLVDHMCNDIDPLISEPLITIQFHIEGIPVKYDDYIKYTPKLIVDKIYPANKSI